MAQVTVPSLEWSVAAAIMPGEAESGDQYLACTLSDGMLFAVMDGLGHGRAAAAAAHVAIATLQRHAGESAVQLLKRCHESLRQTRGVAMSLAIVNTIRSTLTWVGVGNIEGALIHRDAALPIDKLLLRGGVVGAHLPTLYAAELSVRPGDVMIMLTDGVMSDAAQRVIANGALNTVADRILASAAKGTDDALVLVARYGGGTN